MVQQSSVGVVCQSLSSICTIGSINFLKCLCCTHGGCLCLHSHSSPLALFGGFFLLNFFLMGKVSGKGFLCCRWCSPWKLLREMHIFLFLVHVEVAGSRCIWANAKLPQIYKIQYLFPPAVVSSPSHMLTWLCFEDYLELAYFV